MTEGRRKRVLLAVLLVLLLVVAWRQLGPRFIGGGSGRGGARTVGLGAGDRSRGDHPPLPEVVDLRLADLEAAHGELEQGRDPFRLKSPTPVTPTPTPPRHSESELREAMERARARQEVQRASDPTPSGPSPPAIDVIYLGSFGSESRRLAVFTDGREIFNAREGEVLKEMFIVVRIGFESADLGFVGFPDTPARRLEIGG